MEKYLKGALISNSASLGLNWIYNMPYIESLAAHEEILFQKEDPVKYEHAKKSYLAYPYAEIGDVSFQGNIVKWLYSALENKQNFTQNDYINLVYDQIKPAGQYVGYVESYGRKLVANELNKSLKSDYPPYEQNDDQLVGFVPYLVCKELNLSNDYAWDLAQAFTNLPIYKDLYTLTDYLLKALKENTMQKAIELSLDLVPKDYLDKVKKGLELSDTKTYISNYVNTACHIDHAIPLILHILYHTNTYEQAVKLNTTIGGASSDRGLLLGAIAAQAYKIPLDWENKVNYK